MTRGKHGNHAKASRQHRWKVGGLLASNGYVKVRVGKDHPLADPNGYAYEHLLVWVSAGKPMPDKGEIIHHKNEDKTDNRLGNLQIMSRSEHSKLHHATLTDDEVRAIRYAYADGKMNMVELASLYNAPIQRISKIIRGETRKAAGGPLSIGKKAAGRLLDGVEWNQFPSTEAVR